MVDWGSAVTLRLVGGLDAKVTRLETKADIVSGLRALANTIESGKLERAETILLVSQSAGMVDFAAIGKCPTIAEALGLLDLAHAKIVRGAWKND